MAPRRKVYFDERLLEGAIEQLYALYLIYTWGYPVSSTYFCVDTSEHTYTISPFLVLFSIGKQLMDKLIHDDVQLFYWP